MTLKEAIESGKPYRHKDAPPGWLFKMQYIEYPVSMIISDDWEVKQKQTFTRTELLRALHEAFDYYETAGTDRTRVEFFDVALKAAGDE